MEERKFSVKQRNGVKKSPRPLILLITESRNIKETLYFQQFQKQYDDYNIKIIISEGFIDSGALLKKLENFWNTNAMDRAKGDRILAVLDLDCNDQKNKLMKNLEDGAKITDFIVSNPYFEVGYLLHYKYTTHVYLNGVEIIRDLKKYISDYEETRMFRCC